MYAQGAGGHDVDGDACGCGIQNVDEALRKREREEQSKDTGCISKWTSQDA